MFGWRRKDRLGPDDELVEGTIRDADGNERMVVVKVHHRGDGSVEIAGWSESIELPPGASFMIPLAFDAEVEVEVEVDDD